MGMIVNPEGDDLHVRPEDNNSCVEVETTSLGWVLTLPSKNGGKLIAAIALGTITIEVVRSKRLLPEFTREELTELMYKIDCAFKKVVCTHGKQKKADNTDELEMLARRVEQLETVTRHAAMRKQIADKFKKLHDNWEVGDEYPLNDSRLVPTCKRCLKPEHKCVCAQRCRGCGGEGRLLGGTLCAMCNGHGYVVR